MSNERKKIWVDGIETMEYTKSEEDLVEFSKKTMTSAAGLTALAASCIYAFFSVLAIISLAVSDEKFLTVFPFLLIDLSLAGSQIVLSAFLCKRKEGKRFIIPLIVLFSFNLFVCVFYFATNMATFWNIFQFCLSLVSFALLIAALVIKNQNKSGKENDDESN